MARVGAPQEKIEKDQNSKSNCSKEIPLRVHQTNTPFTLTPPSSSGAMAFRNVLVEG